MVNTVDPSGAGRLVNPWAAMPAAWIRFDTASHRVCSSESYNRRPDERGDLSSLEAWFVSRHTPRTRGDPIGTSLRRPGGTARIIPYRMHSGARLFSHVRPGSRPI